MDGKELRKRLETHRYADTLFPKEPMSIQLKVDEKSYFLSISRGEILFSDDDDGKKGEIILSGSEKAIREVVEGRVKLREAIRLNQLEAKSPFRSLLLLESILWLAGNS